MLFVDAAHFVMGAFLGWVWCATRLFVRAASGRQRYNALGAINAVSHELIRVTNDGYINAQTVCELLRKILDLQETINDCLNRTATDYRDELDTLLSHNFQTFDNVSILAG